MRKSKQVLPTLLRYAGLLFLAIAMSVGTALAQTGTRTVTGIVVDETGEPLTGANVRTVKVHEGDAIHGVAVDMNGHFQLTFPLNVTSLLVSYLGYNDQTVELTNDSSYKITLLPATNEVEEVVINGAFTRNANTFTGAVVSMKGEDLRSVGNSNVLQSIKNLDPSFLQVENLAAGSDPNKLPDFQMRGSSTVGDVQGEYASSANQPLFILDGFEAELTKILDLDMNQVESVSLLKDATAKAIYGAKAANGVIVVETIRPTEGKIRVSYNGSLSVEAPDLSSYNLCNATEKLQVEQMAGLFTDANGNVVNQIALDQAYTSKLRDVLAGSNTDWRVQPLRFGVGNKHSLRIEGGDKATQYGVDLSYNNIEGAMKGSDRNTFTGAITLAYRWKGLSVRNKLDVDYNESNNSPWGTFDQYCQMNPYSRIYDTDGNLYKSYSYTNNAGTVGDYYNPIYNTTLNTIDKTSYTSITDNLYAEYQLLETLRLTGRLGIVHKQTGSDVFKPASHTDFLSTTDAFAKGSYAKGTGQYNDISGDLGASYSRQMGKHLLFGNAQVNFTNNVYSTANVLAVGYANDYMDDISFGVQYEKNGKPTGTEGILRTVGGLLSFNYSYDERYLFDANYRITGSSETAPEHRWGQFWSLGAGWNLHNEGFLKDVAWINRLKLRGSIGYTGSQGFSSYDAKATFLYYSSESYGGSIGSYIKGLANPDLHWQEKYDTDLGIDINLFDNRLSARYDWYLSRTDGMITSVTTPYTTGFSTYIANLGKVENRGHEAYLNYRLFQHKRDYWNIFASAASNTNTLKEISNGLSEWNKEQDASMLANGTIKPSVKYYEGCSMNAIWAVKSLGIDPENGKEIFVKKDGTVTYEYDIEDQVVCGDALPKVNANVGTNGEFHGFGFNVTANIRYGGQIYNSTLVEKVENCNVAYNVDRRVLTDRWQQAGDMARFKAITDKSTTYPTSRFVEDYNTFTLSALNLSYDFRECHFMQTSKVLERLKVTAYTTDLFVLSSVKTERGTSYPFARTFSFAVQAVF